MDDSIGSLPPTAERLDASAISSVTGRLSASAQADDSRSPSMRRRAETEDSEKAGRVWAREVEEAWWPCILTLDGGGIRGYSSLLILKALMHEIWLWEEKLEAEEAEDQVEDLVDSPLDEEQPSLGAHLREAPLQEPKQSKVEDVRGRSPLKQHMDAADTISIPGDEAEAVEKQHGVSIPSPPPENFAAAAAQHTVHQDNITADISAKKALTEEELLPCHYFDFMYGTSTGGLIGTMLGRLRMTVTECLELYRKVGEDLFGKQKSRIPLRTKYYHEPLERAVREVVGARCHEHSDCSGRDDLHPWEMYINKKLEPGEVAFDVEQPRVCQSCCLTATHDEQISEAHLLRSYPHFYTDNSPNWITRYNEGADELPIWQVTRATSAAPFYFEMVRAEVDGVSKSFKDGGIRENNPSGAALSEFHALYEGKAHQPALLLSVGTGRPDQSQDGFASNWPEPIGRLPFVSKFLEKRAVIQNLLIKYTEGEKQHHQMREHAHGENTWYKRLNVSHGLESFPLDDWKRGEWNGQPNVPGGASLTYMEEMTAKYLGREFDNKIDSYAPPERMLRQAAEKLVRQRRAREQEGGPRWETFIGKALHKPKDQANGNAG